MKENKSLIEMMEIILLEEKEKYFLELAKQGAKLPSDYQFETLVAKEEETETAKLKKMVQDMQY